MPQTRIENRAEGLPLFPPLSALGADRKQVCPFRTPPLSHRAGYLSFSGFGRTSSVLPLSQTDSKPSFPPPLLLRDGYRVLSFLPREEEFFPFPLPFPSPPVRKWNTDGSFPPSPPSRHTVIKGEGHPFSPLFSPRPPCVSKDSAPTIDGQADYLFSPSFSLGAPKENERVLFTSPLCEPAKETIPAWGIRLYGK